MNLDQSGRPMIAFFDSATGELGLLHCQDQGCQTPTDPVYVGGGQRATYLADLAIRPNGDAVLVYASGLDGGLRVLACTSPSCNDSPQAPEAGLHTYAGSASLSIDDAGRPVIAYSTGQVNVFGSKLRFLHCTTTDCSGAQNPITLDADASNGYVNLSLSGGNPVISYFNSPSYTLRRVRCGNADCTSQNEGPHTVDPDGDVGWYVSQAVDSCGNTVLSYTDYTAYDLKVLRTHDRTCAPAHSSGVVRVVDSHGSPLAGVPVKIRSSAGATTSYLTDGNGLVNPPEPLASGTYTVTVASGTQSKSLSIPADGSGSVTFRTVPVTATLANSTGAPLPGAVAQAGSTGVFNPKVEVDQTGTAVFEVLAGKNTFTAWMAGGYLTKSITVTPDAVNAVTFHTVPVVVHINDPAPGDLVAARVTQAGKSGTFGPKTPVDGNGEVAFEVLPGTNSFTAWVAAGYQTQTVSVAEGTGNRVEFDTFPVAVRVTDQSGRPWQGATVTHAGNTGAFTSKALVDSDGQVVYQALRGTSTFTAWNHLNSAYATKQLTVTQGVDLTIALPGNAP